MQVYANFAPLQQLTDYAAILRNTSRSDHQTNNHLAIQATTHISTIMKEHDYYGSSDSERKYSEKRIGFIRDPLCLICVCVLV